MARLENRRPNATDGAYRMKHLLTMSNHLTDKAEAFCDYCKKPMHKKRSNQKFCSEDCKKKRIEANRKRRVKINKMKERGLMA